MNTTGWPHPSKRPSAPRPCASRHLRHRRADCSARGSRPVGEPGDAHTFSAVVAAEELAASLQPVADDPDAAGCAMRGQRLDRAFETVISMRLAVFDHLEGFIVVVAAGFTSRHGAASKLLAPATKTSLLRARFRLATKSEERAPPIAREPAVGVPADP